jgi:predicted TIM-barrel fold metal-dependent hydrolase
MPPVGYLWYLQRLVEGGFASRIVFRWTSPIRSNRVFQTIVDAPFLSREEKAGMLCGNAARFLRLAASV